MTIEKRLERVEAILDARGLDWDHPRVASDHFADADKMVADEPAKEASLDGLPDIRTFAQPNLRWRILEPGELIKQGDWYCLKSLPSCNDPVKGNGWLMTGACGSTVREEDACVYARPVADEPAKEPEHPAGPKPDPGKGYRILSKDPLEDLEEGDEHELYEGCWVKSDNARTHKRQAPLIWYRRKIEPANDAQPAWEPKVWDWVKVTRPENWKEWKDPLWREEMHIYDGKVFEFVKWSQWSAGQRASLQGIDWFFHRDWLSPAEPPAIDKPAEPEYREPVLPADANKKCQFSDDGQSWLSGWVYGWVPDRNWVTLNNNSWKHARIKKDA